jgi:ATP/maltotriose-dependent transcriptional regulator MalT
LTTVYHLVQAVSLKGARTSGTGHGQDKETPMTQTMPELAASRSTVGAAAGIDGTDLAAVLQALEARKALLAGAVAALAAPDDLAGTLFEALLADPEARQWPFDLARVHLLYGERLRRSREIAKSRHHLQAALATFEQLDASAWTERAAAELAATTPTRRRRETGHADPLTAQELQVAELAAAGLTNKEIAGRLYMSHRTVSAHLYRVFPKLGITARAALRDALSRPDAQWPVRRG